jgi:hypothetical protein
VVKLLIYRSSFSRPHSRAVVRIAPDPLLREVFSAEFRHPGALSRRVGSTWSPSRCIFGLVGPATLLSFGSAPRSRRVVCPKLRVSPLNAQTDFAGGLDAVQELSPRGWVVLFFLFVRYASGPLSCAAGPPPFSAFDRKAFPGRILLSGSGLPPPCAIQGGVPSPGSLAGAVRAQLRFTCADRRHTEDWSLRYPSASHLPLRRP